MFGAAWIINPESRRQLDVITLRDRKHVLKLISRCLSIGRDSEVKYVHNDLPAGRSATGPPPRFGRYLLADVPMAARSKNLIESTTCSSPWEAHFNTTSRLTAESHRAGEADSAV
jgi:hypothetical protein